jgi:formamidopyrimidine-DNA glycosylase
MPELPDLEVFSQHLGRQLSGKKLTRITIITKDIKANISGAGLKKKLEGAALKDIRREGKELFFIFKNGHTLGFHLMLHGKFSWVNGKEIPDHTLLVLLFSNKKELALTDFQRQARVTLDPTEKDIPDALSPEADLDFWKEKMQSKARVKNLLLDQDVVRGIGNAYADEILWEAGISPFSIAAKVPAAKVKALSKAIPKVLKYAIRQIKKKSPDIIGGEVRDFLAIHNSSRKKSPTGALIKREKKGRITYYTDEQELYT